MEENEKTLNEDFKWEDRRIGPSYDLHKVLLSNTTLTMFNTACHRRFFGFVFRFLN